jgi:hypothetical protein
VDLRILEGRACLDAFQRDQAIAMQARGVDAFAVGQVSGEFAQSFAELAGGADRIAAFRMVQADRKVDEGLQEEAARAALRGPDLFPDFVALEELAAVEEVDAAFE